MLRTLGKLELADRAFGRTKPLTLLAYLALEGPTTRRQLRTLFWGNTAEGGNSLRVTLSHLRTVLPDKVLVEGEQVQVQLSCDAVLLLRAMQEHRHADALALYGGPFLPGGAGHSTELEEWWAQTRDYLASRAAQAALALGEAAAGTGNWDQGSGFAAQALDILSEVSSPPLVERAYRLIRAADDPAYELLLAAYDFPLTPLTPQQAQASLMPTGWGLPLVPEGPFFGREDELNWLLRHVLRSRFVTVRGLGGSGKTRLVQALLAQPSLQSTFQDMVWIEVGHEAPETLLSAISQQLGLAAPMTPEALAKRLSGRRVLLILDGADDLNSDLPLWRELDQRMPQVHVLLTTRTALGLNTEEVLMLGSFALPGGELGVAHPARQLLTWTAERLGHPLPQTPEATEDQEGICRLVGGLPLALQQAGMLCQTLPLSQVRRALGRDLRNLEPSDPSASSGFQRIWQALFGRLSKTERHAVIALSPVSGPLDADLAAALHTPLRLLSRLHDLGVLERRPDGQFGWSPLVRAYAQLEGTATQRDTARQHLTEVILLLLNERAGRWQDPSLQRWAEDHAQDIRTALCHGVQEDSPAIRGALDGALNLYEAGDRYKAALDLYAELEQYAGPRSPLRASILNGRAWFALRLGLWEDGRTLALEAQSLLAPDERTLRMQLENILGIAALSTGDATAAQTYFRRALESSLVLRDRPRQITYLGNLAGSQEQLGAFSESSESYRQALILTAMPGEEARRSALVGGWAYLHLFRIPEGQVEQAAQLLSGQIARLGELDLKAPPYLSLYLAWAALILGEIPRAQAAARQARELSQASHEQAYALDAALVYGRALSQGGEQEAGEALLLDSLRQAGAVQRVDAIVDALLFYAESQSADGAVPQWVQELPVGSLSPFQQRLYHQLLARPSAQSVKKDQPIDVWLALQLLSSG